MSDAGGQMPDMGSLFAQAQKMSEQLMAKQAEAEATIIDSQAGGGAVKIQMTGAGEFLSVKIDPSAVDPDDVEMLEDLVLAALNDVSTQAEELRGGGDLDDLDMGGLDLGGLDLGGLLGGGGDA